MFRTGKTVLARWADRNRQTLRIPGLGSVFGPFFFEFSKVNDLKINLTNIFLIYASVNHLGILQRQFENGSCFHSTQSLTSANISYKEQIFYFHRNAICRTTGLLDRRTIGISDNRSDPLFFYLKFTDCDINVQLPILLD